MIQFTVPGKPIGKERPRMGRGGRFYTPRTTLDYEKAVATIAAANGAKPVECPIRIHISAFLPDARRRDLDNIVKSILDALNGVAYEDDTQVISLFAAKAVDRKYPRVEVTLWQEAA